MLENLQPWELLLKKILWAQLGNIKDKRILDFGSGTGVTSSHYAKNNEIIAVEPDGESIKSRCKENDYIQLQGSIEVLKEMPDNSFDIIFCHNVLEYIIEKADIINEFYRLLKPDGKISIVKHNRAGRVMQMVVLLNDFEKAHELLDGKDSVASKYGAIRYYEDNDIVKWCKGLKIAKTYGIRTLWDLQQNQEIHKDKEWQDKMIEVEMRVSDIKEYKDIAFFHHLILKKED